MIRKGAYFQSVRRIAVWEFWRFFKIHEQVWSFLIALGIGLAVFGGSTLVKRITDRETREGRNRITLAVLNEANLPLVAPESGRIRFEPATEPLDALKAKVDAKELTGILKLSSTDTAELIVAKAPTSWRGELEPLLNQARATAKMIENKVSPEAVAGVLSPISLNVGFTEKAAAPLTTADKMLAIAVTFFTSLAIFGGMATLFVGITGEKSQRVTELVISAISPQAWIDGKIIGHSMVAFASTSNTFLSFVAFYTIMWALELPIPEWIDFRGASPGFLALATLIAVAAFFMWFSFFAAIAATIDDPNNSNRTVMLFLPLAPMVLAMMLISHPDSIASVFLSLFPPTAAPMLTLRLAVSEVPIWQVVAGIGLIVGSTWLLRALAARIFTVGMMMHGKEPSIREMLRWAREA